MVSTYSCFIFVTASAAFSCQAAGPIEMIGRRRSQKLEADARSTLVAVETALGQDELSDGDRTALNLAGANLRGVIEALDNHRRRALPSPFVLFIAAMAVVALAGTAGWASAERSPNTPGGEARLAATDLRDADLAGAELDGVDLRAACLQGVLLPGASLTGTNLADADLRGAQLASTELSQSLGVFIIDDETVLPPSFDASDRTRRAQPGERSTCG